jgi:hypothetical protein
MSTSVYQDVVASAPGLMAAIQQNPDGATLLIAFLAFLAWLKQGRK